MYISMAKLQLKDDYSANYPFLKERTFPDPDSQFVELPNHTRIAYKTYYDASHDAKNTVVFLPGTPGSRFFTHPDVKKHGYVPGVNFIVIDRPGLGGSSASSKTANPVSIASFAEVFQQFCEALGLTSVLVLAYSAGTPYALAVAARCPPGLVRAVAVVGCIAPNYRGIHVGMGLYFRFGYWCCTAWPAFVRWAISSEWRSAMRGPLAALRSGFATYRSCKADKVALDKPEVEGMFLESYLELVSRGQQEAVIQETLAVPRPWGFELQEIQVPLAVWQGEKDLGCTQGMAHHVGAAVPGCQVNIVPGQGHMVWFQEETLQQVVAWLLKH